MIAQILAVVIFIAMFVLIVLEVWERHVITLGCGLLTLVLVFGLGKSVRSEEHTSELQSPR